MLLGALSGNTQMILLGLTLIVVGYVLRRSYKKVKQSTDKDPAQLARNRFLEAEQSAAGRINKLESRLHDYGREIEGRMESRIKLLDQLLLEADQKIAELNARLEKLPQNQNTPAETTSAGGSNSPRDDK